MRMPTALFGAILTAALAAPASADGTIIHRQNGAINIKPVVLMGPYAGRTVMVGQTGLYNSAAIVDPGSGGYGAIYQRGHTNRAHVSQFGARGAALIDQMHLPLAEFGRFSVLKRR
ncbi:MAG: hypothetical protein NXH91_13370 [Phyllobacteriaceae bacterium]|nr:hypothetical protein [Phyllobacteriaceae bacterium]